MIIKSRRATQPDLSQLTRRVAIFNKRVPVGTKVEVTLDDGELKETTTRSAAWIMGGHSAMVMLEGISGAYRIDRVRPL